MTTFPWIWKVTVSLELHCIYFSLTYCKCKRRFIKIDVHALFSWLKIYTAFCHPSNCNWEGQFLSICKWALRTRYVDVQMKFWVRNFNGWSTDFLFLNFTLQCEEFPTFIISWSRFASLWFRFGNWTYDLEIMDVAFLKNNVANNLLIVVLHLINIPDFVDCGHSFSSLVLSVKLFWKHKCLHQTMK